MPAPSGKEEVHTERPRLVYHLPARFLPAGRGPRLFHVVLKLRMNLLAEGLTPHLPTLHRPTRGNDASLL